MSCSDKLRDLPKLQHTGRWVTNEKRPDVRNWVHDPSDCPLCLAAAVIEAAENARDYAHDGDLVLGGQKCDWDESELGPCPGCRLGDALAALARRLETQP